MSSNKVYYQDLQTLSHFILEERKKKVCMVTDEFIHLINSIQSAIKAVSCAVRQAAIRKLYYNTGNINIQGEKIKKLDVLSHEIFVNMLESSNATCFLLSEECENIIKVDPEKSGNYIVCFDPLDGSSNIECLVSIGSIFSIYKINDKIDSLDDDETIIKNILRPGREIVAAGYALYGSATSIILSFNTGVHHFIFDEMSSEFLLVQKNVKIPEKGNIYSINEGNESQWNIAFKNYVNSKKYPKAGAPYTSRYVGSMVADIHRTLTYGGIFLYPGTDKNPSGKLRLLYECIPMAYLVEQAGGKASNGVTNILDLIPAAIHERSPIFIGSKYDVDDVLHYINM